MTRAMKRIWTALLATACLGAAGCDSRYLERKDTLTFGVGDAVSTNNAAQIADPWPRRSQNTRIPMDGAKAERALARYRGLGPVGGLGPGAGPAPGGIGGYAPPGGAPPPPPQ
jgi:hypothetical protein